MPTRRITLPGALTGRRAPADFGYVHFCAESCVHITPLERVVLENVARGRANKEIGIAMAVSSESAHHSVQRLMKKLAVHDRTQLALMAVASGLIDNPHEPFGKKGT